MLKNSVFGNVCLAAYFLGGLFLFTPKNDEVPEGFKLSGEGSLLWDESTQTLTVFQENKSAVLTISEAAFPKIDHQIKVPGGQLILKIANGNPTSLQRLSSNSGSVMIINPNGILVGEGDVFDVSGPVTLSTLDIDSEDFLDGGDNRFRGNNGVVNYGEIEVDGETIILGNFVDPHHSEVSMGAGGDLIIHDGTEKTTTFEFEEFEEFEAAQ